MLLKFANLQVDSEISRRFSEVHSRISRFFGRPRIRRLFRAATNKSIFRLAAKKWTKLATQPREARHPDAGRTSGLPWSGPREYCRGDVSRRVAHGKIRAVVSDKQQGRVEPPRHTPTSLGANQTLPLVELEVTPARHPGAAHWGLV